VPEGHALLRHDQLASNPLNPRKLFDEAEIAALADTMAEAKGVLQNLLATTALTDGAHLLLAGERRWRAWGLLIADGRWAEDRRLLVKLQEPDESHQAQAVFMGLIENGQRTPLAWIEEARAYQLLCEGTGWSAREAAKRTGKNERVVQEMLKVLKEARPIDIEAVERGDMTVEHLRHSVRNTTQLANMNARAEEQSQVRRSLQDERSEALTQDWPTEPAALVEIARAAMVDFNDAVVDDDAEAAADCVAKFDAVVRKLNGGTTFGSSSVRDDLRSELSAETNKTSFRLRIFAYGLRSRRPSRWLRLRSGSTFTSSTSTSHSYRKRVIAPAISTPSGGRRSLAPSPTGSRMPVGIGRRSAQSS
jgi:ParB/RepB/Spo0J family partition protein